MQNRTKATSITMDMRRTVLDRDKWQCIHCGTNYQLTIAHAYLSRSKGGKGIAENLCVLCMLCHHQYDNGMKKEQEIVKEGVIRHMQSHYGLVDLEKIKYKKGE
jgi:5-methylcytosine-specific restriction endonuclease McrA